MPCDKDRRVIYVALADLGTKTLAALDEPLVALHPKLLGHLPRAELKELIRLLEKVREPLTGVDDKRLFFFARYLAYQRFTFER